MQVSDKVVTSGYPTFTLCLKQLDRDLSSCTFLFYLISISTEILTSLLFYFYVGKLYFFNTSVTFEISISVEVFTRATHV